MPQPEKNAWGERLNAHLTAVPKFRIGDVCFLNSGGPAMTVSGIRSGDIVEVVWVRDGAPSYDAFLSACLRRSTWLKRLNAAFGG